jgi:hypothetical protein
VEQVFTKSSITDAAQNCMWNNTAMKLGVE